MHIILINGNSSCDVSQGIYAAATAVCQGWHDVSCEVITPAFGPRTVEGYLDGDLAAVAVARQVAKTGRNADAIIIACYSDPGLQAAREMVTIPVVGIAQASMVVAVQLGCQFSILTPLARLRPVLAGLVRRYGFSETCLSIETVPLSVSDAQSDRQQTLDAFIEAGKHAVMQGAEVLILGGAVLAGMESQVSAALGVPVLDPVKCALGQAVSLAEIGLMTSKAGGYAVPRDKECANCPDELGLFYRHVQDGVKRV